MRAWWVGSSSRQSARTRPGVVAVLAVVGLAGLASCGDSSTSTPTASSPKCQLAPGTVQPVAADAPAPSGRVVARLQSFAGFGDIRGSVTSLVVYDSGEVVSFGQEYHRGQVSSDAIAAITACADAVGFASLEPMYLAQSRQNSEGKFCSVADAATTDVLAPTGAGPKTVSAYALSMTTSTGCLTFPSGLTDTYAMLRQVGDQTQQTGAPWTPTSVAVRRASAAPTDGRPATPWPSIPVPAEGAVERVEGADAQALLRAVQPPATSDTTPRHFRPGGEQPMTLPDGTVANITYLVVLPGDRGITL